jgi:hypothetical protein
MISRTIDNLLIIVIAVGLSGCCNVPTGIHGSHSVVSWDGLRVPGNAKNRQLQRSTTVYPKDRAAELSANNSLLLADELEAEIGERVSFEKLDRTLTICRGC